MAAYSPDEVWAHVLKEIQNVRTTVRRQQQQQQQQAGGFQQFSGCFFCLIPQPLCTRWAADEGGSFVQLSSGVCSYEGILSTFLGFCIAAKFVDEDACKEAVAIVRKCGIWVADGIELEPFLRLRIQWNGLEVNGACILFLFSARISFLRTVSNSPLLLLFLYPLRFTL